jgi:hypothetical protein
MHSMLRISDIMASSCCPEEVIEGNVHPNFDLYYAVYLAFLFEQTIKKIAL